MMESPLCTILKVGEISLGWKVVQWVVTGVWK